MEQTRLQTEETKGQATQGNSAWRTGMAGLFALSFVRDSMPFFTLGKIRCFIFTLLLKWIALFRNLIAQPNYRKNKTWDTYRHLQQHATGSYQPLLLRATRVARSFHLQVIIMYASQVCSRHSFGLPLIRMNEIHRKQFDHSHLDLLWSLRLITRVWNIYQVKLVRSTALE